MFLRAGVVPQPGWVAAADHFMQTSALTDAAGRAGLFRLPGTAGAIRPGFADLAAMLRAAVGGGPRPEQGLLIARRLYETVGGHSAGDDAETAILRQIGRRRLVILPVAITITNT
jgi:hypothetical protein